MTPQERADAVFTKLASEGKALLFEETGWMNPEDVEAVTGPIASAIQDAINEERRRCVALAFKQDAAAVGHAIMGKR